MMQQKQFKFWIEKNKNKFRKKNIAWCNKNNSE